MLKGVDICGEISLLVTNDARKFNWEDYGLTLDIPCEALPNNIDQCKLLINASISGDYTIPNGFLLVSPVFWVRCEPSCKFKKTISMGIQHCAKTKDKSKLRFARASCTQKELPYMFEVSAADKNFDTSSIQLNRFSACAIVKDGSDDLSFAAKVFYFTEDIGSYMIHFTVSLDTPAHRTVRVSSMHVNVIGCL